MCAIRKTELCRFEHFIRNLFPGNLCLRLTSALWFMDSNTRTYVCRYFTAAYTHVYPIIRVYVSILVAKGLIRMYFAQRRLRWSSWYSVAIVNFIELCDSIWNRESGSRQMRIGSDLETKHRKERVIPLELFVHGDWVDRWLVSFKRYCMPVAVFVWYMR